MAEKYYDVSVGDRVRLRCMGFGLGTVTAIHPGRPLPFIIHRDGETLLGDEGKEGLGFTRYEFKLLSTPSAPTDQELADEYRRHRDRGFAICDKLLAKGYRLEFKGVPITVIHPPGDAAKFFFVKEAKETIIF